MISNSDSTSIRLLLKPFCGLCVFGGNDKKSEMRATVDRVDITALTLE